VGLFRRKKRIPARVRILSATGPGMHETLNSLRDSSDIERRKRDRTLLLSVTPDGGEPYEVEKKMMVPTKAGVEGLVESGAELPAQVDPEDPSDVEIDWNATQEVAQADFARLFHKQGSPQERLEILERLNGQGLFTAYEYENGRRMILAELGED
jgi:hypothetical protein